MSGKRPAVLLTAALLLGVRLEAAVQTEDIAAAMSRAVQARVGREARVTVSGVAGVRLASRGGHLVAQAEPSARAGQPVRFLFSEQDGPKQRRIGEATATIDVVADAVRVRHDVVRGATLEASDLVVRSTDLRGRPFGPLPSLEETIGARAKRDIGADAVVTRADIAAEPLVRAGDIVRVHVRIGDVEVVGQLVALESGPRNAIIRVVNQETRHAARARVIGRAEVEVVDVP